MSDRQSRNREEQWMEDDRMYRDEDDYNQRRRRGFEQNRSDSAARIDREQRRSTQGMGNYEAHERYRPDYPQGVDQRTSNQGRNEPSTYRRQRNSAGHDEDFGDGTGGWGNQSGFGNAHGQPGAVGEGIGMGGQGWMGDGPHAGRGPKGYSRSDDRIMEDVCERLTHHRAIDASEIEVQVNNGEVTLSGTIDSRRNKRMAESILDDITGIKDVHNQLRVRQNNES